MPNLLTQKFAEFFELIEILEIGNTEVRLEVTNNSMVPIERRKENKFPIRKLKKHTAMFGQRPRDPTQHHPICHTNDTNKQSNKIFQVLHYLFFLWFLHILLRAGGGRRRVSFLQKMDGSTSGF